MSMSPKQREALLAACFENTLESELYGEVAETGIDIAGLADALLANLYGRLDNISTEAPLADALRYGLTNGCPGCPGDASTHVDMVACRTCDEGQNPIYRIDFPEPETEPDSPDASDLDALRYDEQRAAEKDES